MKQTAINNKFCVYIHVTPSNKKYIGITSKPTNKRWENGSGYRNNRHFYNAIQKYGWNNIQHIIVAENLDLEEATNLEIKLIAKYKTDNPLYGYNHTTGGEINQVFTEETRKKMSDSAKIRVSTEKGKENMIRAIAASKLNPHGNKVVYDGVVYDSIKKCGEAIGINPKMLSCYLTGSRSFEESLKNKGIGYYGVKAHYEEAKTTHDKPVICDGIIYKTCAECNRAYRLRNGAIKEYLSGCTKMPRKFKDLGLRYIEYKRYYYIIDG